VSEAIAASMSTIRYGITFYSLLDLPLHDILECFKLAEKRGFHYGFLSHSALRDAFVGLAKVASVTSKMKLGTNVVPIYPRTPTEIAMSAATLAEAFDGRFDILGLGLSTHFFMEAYHGLRLERPVARMREYVEVIRSLLSGDRISYKGKFFEIRDCRLMAGKVKVPIYLGSTGPQMLKLTGELADGVILNSCSTPEYITDALKIIEEAAGKVGRRLSDLDIACSIVTCALSDEEEARQAAKRAVLYYIRFPTLDPIVRRAGLYEEAQAVRQAYWSGDEKKAVELVTDSMVNAFTVAGTPDQCVKKLKKYLDVGVQFPIIRSTVDIQTGTSVVNANINAVADLIRES